MCTLVMILFKPPDGNQQGGNENFLIHILIPIPLFSFVSMYIKYNSTILYYTLPEV